MTTAFIIFIFIILSTVINAVVSDNRVSKIKKDCPPFEHQKYPTKEEFIENVRKIQENELKSDRFKEISQFMVKHNERKNIELEEQLFKIVGAYGIEEQLYNKSLEEKKTIRFNRFKKLKEFMSSLSQEQIDSNLYLQAVQMITRRSIEDCKIIENELKEKVDEMCASSITEVIEVNVDIPEETLKLLPTRISEQVKVQYYDPSVYSHDYVYLLDEENRHIYSEYNKYVSKIDKLTSDIYLLQMWDFLLDYPEQVDNYYFNILNNSFEHEFLTGYFVKSKVLTSNSSYEIDDKTKQMISKIVGLPFEDVIKMSIDELDNYLDSKFGKRLNRDLAWTQFLSKTESIEYDKGNRISFQIK